MFTINRASLISRLYFENPEKTCVTREHNNVTQQDLPAALAAVPWLLACSGLRGEDRARQGKNDVHFACRARAASTTF